MAARALVLFAHGARAPGWAAPFERLRDRTRARLPGVNVSLAFLELMEPRLPDQVAALVDAGMSEVTVVPVFLGTGGHLLRDLPLLVDKMRADHPDLTLTVAGAIGEDPGVLAAMTEYCVNSVS
jgi:sirohydrochlorin cobaltochelatase